MNNYECRIWIERGSELEYVEIEGKKVYLTGWNGESWTECWTERAEETENGYEYIRSDNFECYPLYAFESYGLDSPGEDADDDMTAYVGIKTWKDLENT